MQNFSHLGLAHQEHDVCPGQKSHMKPCTSIWLHQRRRNRGERKLRAQFPKVFILPSARHILLRITFSISLLNTLNPMIDGPGLGPVNGQYFWRNWIHHTWQKMFVSVCHSRCRFPCIYCVILQVFKNKMLNLTPKKWQNTPEVQNVSNN